MTGAGEAQAADVVPDPAEQVAARLSVVVGRLIRQLRRVGTADIGPGALSALSTLNRCGPMRLGDLAQREGIAPPTLSRIVAALEDAGYVVRETDPRDRRAVRVAVTGSGTTVVQGIGTARTGHLTARLHELPPDRLQALLAALPALEELTEGDL